MVDSNFVKRCGSANASFGNIKNSFLPKSHIYNLIVRPRFKIVSGQSC